MLVMLVADSPRIKDASISYDPYGVVETMQMSPKARDGLCVLLPASYWSAGAGPAVGGVLEGAENSPDFLPSAPCNLTCVLCWDHVLQVPTGHQPHGGLFTKKRIRLGASFWGLLSSRAGFILRSSPAT